MDEIHFTTKDTKVGQKRFLRGGAEYAEIKEVINFSELCDLGVSAVQILLPFCCAFLPPSMP
jgi:hypothetical protein